MMLTAESRKLVDSYWGVILQRMARTHNVKPWELFSPKRKSRKIAALRRELVRDLAENVLMHEVKRPVGSKAHLYRAIVKDEELAYGQFYANRGWQPLSTTQIAELFGMHYSAIVLILGRESEAENSQGECQGVALANVGGVK